MAKAGRWKAWTLQLFPTRVLKRHVEADEIEKGESPISGLSSTRKVHVPTGNNAYERTVRYHEALHQLWSPAIKDGSQAAQAVEDARLHMMKSGTKGQTRRDEVCAGYMDMWAARHTKEADSRPGDFNLFSKTPEQIPQEMMKKYGIGGGSDTGERARVKRDAALIGIIRAAGIFDRGGWRAPSSDKLFRRALQNVLDERAAQGYIDIKQGLEYIRANQPEKAKALLKKYFIATPQEWQKHAGPDGEGEGENRPGVPGRLMQPGHGDKVNMGCAYGSWDAPPGGMPCEEYFNPFIKKMADPKIAKALEKGYFPNMEIFELEFNQSRQMDKGPTEKSAMAGMRIKKKRLAMALSPCPPRLFMRKMKKKAGGSVLIDASGSMNLSNECLKEIADMIPAGTVAYYSGPGFHKDYDGQLVIYAKGGRQYSGTDMPYRKGGNEVDLPALVWLLKQDKPRYFVTDKGFCFGESRTKGGGDVATPAAHDLLRKAEQQGLVKVCQYKQEIMAMLAAQTGKHNLVSTDEE